jgi:hypothetical protein
VTSHMPLAAARHLLPCPCTTAAATLEEVLSAQQILVAAESAVDLASRPLPAV